MCRRRGLGEKHSEPTKTRSECTQTETDAAADLGAIAKSMCGRAAIELIQNPVPATGFYFSCHGSEFALNAVRPRWSGAKSPSTLRKRMNIMQRLLPGVIAMAAIVVASNILVQYLILDGLLTWGAFTYPFAFLVTDLMNRAYGAAAARKVVFVGFIVGVICSLIGSQIMLQGDGYEYAAVALRIAVGSGVAFLIAQLVDVAIFDRMRSGAWWRAPLASTVIGSALDTTLFFTIAFAQSVPFFSENANMEISWAWDTMPLLTIGSDAPLWVSLAIADWMVKMAIALIALIPFRVLTAKFHTAVS